MLKIDINELKTKKFRAFIEYALSNCDCCSFVIDRDNQFQKNLLELLKQNILAEKVIFEHPETGTHFDRGYMITLKCNADIKALFLKADCIADFDGFAFPEELCFYRKGTIWFKLISHERLLFVLNETDKDIDFFEINKIRYNYTI